MNDIEKYHDKLYEILMHHEKQDVPDARECLDYHHQKSNELLKELFYCNLCRGKYASLSKEERTAESKRIRNLFTSHILKAHLLSRGCSIILC